ncbi:hypothetical protein FS837_002917 [Tulasnella sp. UAMH 9824]|nr:hypothetical protein FS837_002917 [Tulasnella sp. UAMH 9824]
MFGELSGFGFVTPTLSGDGIWRLHRKHLRSALSLTTIKREYSDLFLASARRHLETLADDCEAFDKYLKRIVGETITEPSFGAHNDGKGNDYVERHETLVGYIKFIPSWFPLAQFKRDAIIWNSYKEDLRNMMFDGVKQRMALGEHRSCYISNKLEELSNLRANGVDTREDEQAVWDTGFTFFQGKLSGVDTSEYTLRNFILAMSLYPEVQARAREEIDRVIGSGRRPDFGDQAHLPYINAILLERFPQMSREDDTYDGYFIPKGTMIMKNMWGVSRDPGIYKDPSTFNPDRFIDDPNILDPREWAFGFGRRICPGNHLALQLTWIFVVSILWGFEIARPEGEPPLENDADRFDFDFLSSPKPFRCDFILREGVAKILAED